MARSSLLSCVVVMAVAGAAAAQPPRPAPPAPNPSPGADRTFVVDLSKIPSGQAMTLTVPAGEPSRTFILLNRAPIALYRHSIRKEGRGAGASEVRPVEETSYRNMQSSAECAPVVTALRALLTTDDEALVAGRAATVEDLNRRHSCPLYESVIAYLAEQGARPELTSLSFAPAEHAFLAIERLDPTTRAVQKRWDIELVGQGATPAWKYPTETAWVAGSIAEDIARMVTFARAHALLPDDAVAVAAAGDRISVTVRRPGAPAIEAMVETGPSGIWSAATWSPLVRALLGPVPSSAAAAARGTTAATLLDARPEAIAAESRRVSADLSRNMLDAAAHDRAALVLAAFALREEAGTLSDTRVALSRITAHLALARALRAAPSPDGALAAAALLVLSGRQKDGLDALAAIADDSAAMKAWKAALHLRATGDWRAVEKVAAGPLLVRREQFRTLMQRRGIASGLALLDGGKAEPVTDWGRIAMALGPNVESGSRFAPVGPPAEMAEAAAVWKAINGTDLAASDLVAAHNVRPGGTVLPSARGGAEVVVLGWGDWAASSQRHLLAALRALEYHEGRTLGRPPQAATVREAAAGQFSGLDLYPLLALAWANEATDSSARDTTATAAARAAVFRGLAQSCTALAALVSSRPDVIPFDSWDAARTQCDQQSRAGALPAVEAWFNPTIPPGSAHEAGRRLMSRSSSVHDFSQVDALHTRAPFDATLANIYAIRKYGQPQPEEFQAALGPLFDYDRSALDAALLPARGRPSALRAVQQRRCALDVENCLDLAELLVADGLADDAAGVYARVVAEGRDAVLISNRIGWLIDYEWDHGNRERAMGLAQQAAAIGSAGGLSSQARLLERAKRYDEAEAVYKQLAERYRSSGPLQGFYVRYERRVADGKHTREAQDAVTALFPQGLRQVTAKDVDGPPFPPNGGVAVGVLSEAGRRLGLRDGDIVVAVDGWRVRSRDQWNTAFSFRDDPTESLIVFRGGGYIELSGPYPRPKYGP